MIRTAAHAVHAEQVTDLQYSKYGGDTITEAEDYFPFPVQIQWNVLQHMFC